ncbi:mannitol dehydrogenase family protein [Schaalia sp. lx-260]|uniref:mannitol dehydrogenase family protein n=1 Tax=Schaalia sp. lx-260 TaxID=2899082 RepID=UPI001E5AA665|nr:mannitol dehydrogenase family protein [Schaalia sp. lx-260]MCD4548917.1 mannitol dehydrogenase family protein [Schaalia sp. lx-260]
MRLGVESLSSHEMMNAGITLPQFDVSRIRESAIKTPRWMHFGPGNIFRVYIARLAQELMEAGEPQCAISALVPLSPLELDRQLAPFDLLTLGVTLHADGHSDMNVIASLSEGLAYQRAKDFERAATIITEPSLQILSFTITEKGYQLTGFDGQYQPALLKDLERNPEEPMENTMAMVTGLLVRRFRCGGSPLALLSCDNFSHNGDKLRDSVTAVAKEWIKRGLVEKEFLDWLNNPACVSFPISVIDKITPRPSEDIARTLAQLGFEDMELDTTTRTPLAGFVNTEPAEYLVIEDRFPNGRPALEKVGVYFTDRETCDRFEHMKVTTCLNPLHTALAVTGVLLGYTRIDEEMKDPGLLGLVHRLGWDEGMPVVVDPGIISPADFLREVEEERFPNAFLGDTPQRIASDTSQKLPIRFGETIKAYLAHEELDLKNLTAIPFVFAAWCRYLMGVADDGSPMELSPDPLLEELMPFFADVRLGQPETSAGVLRPILSRPEIFGVDLYTTPLASQVEELFTHMIAGAGAVRSILDKEFAR